MTENAKIGTLSPTDGNGWVTWRDAKRQIRSMIKTSGHKAQGTFRPRRENRGELVLGVAGGSVAARKKIGAPVVISVIATKTAADLSPEELAEIMAQG